MLFGGVCLCVCIFMFCFFFFKQKTAYEMRISDWSSDVCSSDLLGSSYASSLDVIGQNVKNYVENVKVMSGGGLDIRFYEPGALEIGRASCRERVCQYV